MKPIRSEDNRGTEAGIGMAKMIGQVLRGQAPKLLTAESSTFTLGHEFGFRLMANHKANERLLEALKEKCGSDVIDFWGIRETTAKRLVGAVTRCGVVRNPIHHLAAVYTISGSLTNFENAHMAAQSAEKHRFESEQSRPESEKLRRKCRFLRGQDYVDSFQSLPEEEQLRLTEKYRGWLMNELQQTPQITRTELWNRPKNRSAIRHFQLIDCAFFEEYFPPPIEGRNRVPSNLNGFLSRLKEHLARKHKLAIQTLPMDRISKTYLLSNFPGETSKSQQLLSREAQELIATYAETHAAYRKRIAALKKMKSETYREGLADA
ncbi:hypothetical protein [Herbaspirillum seropedicae]|uniref:hypothetical protein n=1 Tax=Herbaspirillum seropedicae TaxID=964 RepID=UPI002861E324|nr:hypothetical protein [Herbaspirillum seropedicae]MDR6397474.1 hypothetical protein [Herbaspirillum seropedicae]